MSITIDKLIQSINYQLIMLLGAITNNLPHKIQVLIGKVIGKLLIILDIKRKKITYNNIKSAFPEKSETQINQILLESYQNLGITLIELLYINKIQPMEIKKFIDFENIELIDELLKKDKGLLLLSGHYSNWEYLAFSTAVFSQKPMNVIVKNQKNKKLNKKLNLFRSKSGNILIPLKNAPIEIIKIIRNKGMVALLADQSAVKNRDIYVDLFGRKSLTYIAPAKLAIKYDIPIIMGFAERQENNKYKIKLFELKYDDIKNNENAIEELTQRHVKVLENQIRKAPGQWAWQHNRWKHTK